MQTRHDPDKRKLLSALSHGSIFFSALVLSVGIPIALLFISDDPVVKANAKEAINFHINVWFWGIVISILVWLLVGFLLLPLWIAYNFIPPIWMIYKCLTDADRPHRYPLTVHLL